MWCGILLVCLISNVYGALKPTVALNYTGKITEQDIPSYSNMVELNYLIDFKVQCLCMLNYVMQTSCDRSDGLIKSHILHCQGCLSVYQRCLVLHCGGACADQELKKKSMSEVQASSPYLKWFSMEEVLGNQASLFVAAYYQLIIKKGCACDVCCQAIIRCLENTCKRGDAYILDFLMSCLDLVDRILYKQAQLDIGKVKRLAQGIHVVLDSHSTCQDFLVHVDTEHSDQVYALKSILYANRKQLEGLMKSMPPYPIPLYSNTPDGVGSRELFAIGLSSSMSAINKNIFFTVMLSLQNFQDLKKIYGDVYQAIMCMCLGMWKNNE